MNDNNNNSKSNTQGDEDIKQSVLNEREDEMANGIFRAYNLNMRFLNATLTFKENSLLAVTQATMRGKKNQEKDIPYSSIRSVIVQKQGDGYFVEIKTASENFKFNLFNTKAFIDFLNQKIKVTIKRVDHTLDSN